MEESYFDWPQRCWNKEELLQEWHLIYSLALISHSWFYESMSLFCVTA